MKAEFIQLLDTNFDEAYISQIKEIVHVNSIREAFGMEDLVLREKYLREKLFNSVDPSAAKKFANPYFIGFGNPNSDILVIGKEKAFPADDSKLLIKESINNFCQWKAIVENNMFQMNQSDVATKLGFNPLLPKSYHSGITKRNHTWSITSSIISQIYPNENLVVNENVDIKKSFFNNCFLTELNYVPAKYHEGSGLSPVRQKFLSSPFFKSFPIVIFSAKSYLKAKDRILERIFEANEFPVKEIELDKIGKNKDKVISIKKYSSSRQQIYVCNQLSGASGWSNTSLTNLAEQIKNDLPPIPFSNFTSKPNKM